jgi:hypothetical protein
MSQRLSARNVASPVIVMRRNALIWLPPFEGVRRAAAAEVLERLVGRPVTDLGAVRIRPGASTSIALADVQLGDAGPDAWRGSVRAREISLRFDLREVLSGRFVVDRLSARELAIEVRADPSGDGDPFRISTVSVPLARLLESDLSRQVVLENVSIVRSGDPSGWNGAVVLETARASEDEVPGARTIALDGRINKVPFTLEASFGATDADERRPFSIEAELPGIAPVASGVLHVRGETLEAEIALDVGSLGTALDLFGLQRQIDGNGRVTARVAGPVDALAAERLAVAGELATGERLALDGGIADLATLAGIDLAFSTSFRRNDGSYWRPIEAYDLLLRRAEGRITGSWAALAIADVIVDSNLQVAGADRIGPISVGRIVHDEAGRLALRGLSLEVQEDGRRTLVLEGRVDDVLAFDGVTLDGRFDVDFWELISARPSPADLGRLAGEIGLSDRPGRLVLERLDARLTGGGPLSLRMAMAAPAAPADSPSFEVVLEIADIAALAEALGETADVGGAVRFEGDLTLADQLRLLGRGRIGGSSLWLDLSQDVVGDQVTLTGAIRSPRLQLGDVPRIQALAALRPGRPATADTTAADETTVADEEKATDEATAADDRLPIDIRLDTDATIVDGDDYQVGTFAAKLVADGERVVLSPLQLDYLQGRADAELTINTARARPRLTLDASLRGLSIGALLTELGVQPLLVAPLDAEATLTAAGSDRRSLERSLNGTLELALGEGRIGTRLIDLTGQDIVGWLFSRGADTRLVCAAATVTFEGGRGTVEGLILKTDNVQLVGKGGINLRRETLDLAFAPRPRGLNLLRRGTPFTVKGPIASPEFAVGSAIGVAGRAVVETLTLPLSVLGAIIPRGTAEVLSTCELDN